MQITQRAHHSAPCHFRVMRIMICLIWDWEEGDRELEGGMANCPSADTQHLHLLERRRPAGRWMCQPRTPSPFVQASLCACILLLHAGCCKPRWLPSPGGRILPCLSLATFPPSTKGIPAPWDPPGPGRGPQRAAARCRQLRDDCGADPAPLTPLLPDNLGAARTLLSSAF